MYEGGERGLVYIYMKYIVNEGLYWINSKIWMDLFRFDRFDGKLMELRKLGAV